MNIKEFYYDLPEELIAQDPLVDRSSSRLLTLDKNSGAFSHHVFRDIVDYLNPEGWLLFEIGYDQGEQVSEMMKTAGYSQVKVIKDLAGLDRVVVGKLVQEESGNV